MAPHDEEKLLVGRRVAGVMEVDDQVTRGVADPRTGAERRDAQLEADGSVESACVGELLDLVQMRYCVTGQPTFLPCAIPQATPRSLHLRIRPFLPFGRWLVHRDPQLSPTRRPGQPPLHRRCSRVAVILPAPLRLLRGRLAWRLPAGISYWATRTISVRRGYTLARPRRPEEPIPMRRLTVRSIGLLAILAAACSSGGSSASAAASPPASTAARLDRAVGRALRVGRRLRHGRPGARDPRQAHDRHRQPGLPAVLRRERRRHGDRAVGARRPDQRRGLRERRRLRDRGAARLHEGPGRPGSSCPSPTRSPRAPRPSTSTSTRSPTSRSAPRPPTSRTATTSATSRSSCSRTARSRRRRPSPSSRTASFGAQVGTTSYDAITEIIEPTTEAAAVYDTNDAAIEALNAKHIDGLVVDLPTAVFITDVQLENGTIVGQFEGRHAASTSAPCWPRTARSPPASTRPSRR